MLCSILSESFLAKCIIPLSNHVSHQHVIPEIKKEGVGVPYPPPNIYCPQVPETQATT